MTLCRACVFIVVIAAPALSAQAPTTVICEMERLASAGLDASGKPETTGDTDDGKIILASLNSDRPTASGNLGAEKLRVVKRTDEAVWMIEDVKNPLMDGVGVLTYSFKTRVVLYTKQELLSGKPFALVEIGHCRPPK